MIPERWQEIKKVLAGALERTPDQRSAYLEQACAEPEMRREVESLLLAEEQARASFLASPAHLTGAGLANGSRLGTYEIVARIGAGGMGVVYQARDTKLGRSVAIKVLPPAIVEGHERLVRFRREASLLASLNHPNIATIHGLEESGSTHYLVMELIPGQTLAERLKAGPLEIAEALAIACQIATAMETAHEQGVVHRDLKPANVKVTPDGRVKILDFGLAKALASVGDADLSQAPTMTAAGSEAGTILGTPAYMSPEQARGKPVDKRADIWAFGCVLYELLTARGAFRGETFADTIAAVLGQDPEWKALPASTPPKIKELLRRCLQKDVQQRLRDLGDARIELEEVCASKASALGPSRPRARADASLQHDQLAVAVIPFGLRTGGQDDQFLSLAVADAVIHRLASTGKLVVRPIASVLRYKDTETEWTRIAQDLNVDVVVQGAIQKMGSKVRVLVQTFRVSDPSTPLSAKHDGNVEDLFGLQDRIANLVSDALVSREKPSEEPANPPTKHPLAYELYLRAADRLARMDKFDTESAIEMLTRVVSLDPSFADSWGRLAQACTQMGMHYDPDPQWFDRAEQAIARTLELDPVHCDALCARGQILWSPSRSFQNRAALRAMNASLKINPTREVARQFRAAILFHLGFYDQAERDIEETLLINPGHVLPVQSQGMTALYRGDYEAAHDFYERAYSLNPANVHVNIFSPAPAILMGRLDVAREKIRRSRQIVPDEPQLMAMEGLILAHEGHFQPAEDTADQALKVQKTLTHTHHTWHDAAGVYAMCGKPEKAIPLLRRCAEMGLPNHLLFQSDPHLKNLQDHPEFQALITDLRCDHDRLAEEFGLAGGGR